MLSAQETKLVECLLAQGEVSSADLAEMLQVSERTLRNYIRSANEQMAAAAHIDKRYGGGYTLAVEDEAAFDDLRALSERGLKAIPSTHEERVSYLINDLLQRRGWITLDDLSSILYVSRGVVSGDLKDVERELKRFDLTLEKRPHYGIRVSGSEVMRRICLANLTIDKLFDGMHADDENRVALEKVRACVDEGIKAEGFQVNFAAYQNLLVHIVVAIVRIRDNCYAPMEMSDIEGLRQSREFAVAERIGASISRAFDIELPVEEVAYLAIHLAGKQTLYESPEGSDDEGLVISDEVWDVVSEMLEVIWHAYHFDFRNDLELRMNLARHIVPLAVRIKYHMRMDNPLLADIKERFPLAYSMALDSSAILAQHYGNRLSEDEIGYIALALALALERMKSELPRKNILVICASGQGSAKLLELRYRQEFGAYLNEIITCDVNHLDKIDFSHIDYAFTTVPLRQTLPVPVREVTYFLNATDARNLRELLSSSGNASELSRYFAQELFIPHMQAACKEEALDELCSRVESFRNVPASFRGLVAKREELAQTSFGNFVAMPHPAEAVTDETFVCMGILDAPIAWDTHEVQVVALVSVSKSRNKNLDRFYRGMAGLLTSKQAIQRLTDHQTWETLLSLLEFYGSQEEKE